MGVYVSLSICVTASIPLPALCHQTQPPSVLNAK